MAPPHVLLDGSRGSEAYWAERLLKELGALDIEIVALPLYCAADHVDTFGPNVRVIPSRSRHIPARGMGSATDRLRLQRHLLTIGRDVLRRERFDVLHHMLPFSANGFNCLALGRRARDLPFVIGPVMERQGDSDVKDFANWLGMPVGWRSRGLHYVASKAELLTQYPHRKTLERADALVGVTAAAIDEHRCKDVAMGTRVIAPGVDLPSKIAPKSSHSELQVIVVGDLIPRKRVSMVIEAVQLLVAEGFEARLHVVGDGVERRDLEALVQTLGLRRVVEFYGRVPRERVASLLGAADICCHLPSSEPFGQVMLEALAAGTAVISSRTGASEAIAAPTELVRVLDDCSPQSVASAMRPLIGNVERVRSLGGAARQFAKDRLSWKSVAQKYLALYREVAAR